MNCARLAPVCQTLISGLLLVTPVRAQVLELQPQPLSGTPFIWNRPVQNYSLRTLAKPTVGDTTFYIRADITSEDAKFIEVAFYRKYQGTALDIYVETTEFDAGRVTMADVDYLRDVMLNWTPAGSVNSAQGIFSNAVEIFGDIPDRDQNGKLFILMIDVRDQYQAGVSEAYVAGYFDPLDQVAGKGNYGEILYIDTNPALVNDAMTLSTAAHELQHLIHYLYDVNEEVWLVEGLSELAPRLLGLPARSFGYFMHETNRSLLKFDGDLTDYAKVGLWTYYVYQRFGLSVLKKVVQDSYNSLDSYERAVRSLGFELTKAELLTDWFLANLLNNDSIENGRYGYRDNSIPSVSSPYFSSNFTAGNTIKTSLQPAAAQYIQFYAGKDVAFALQHAVNSNLGMAVIRHYPVPQIEFFPLLKGRFELNDHLFGGAYDRITFVPYSTSVIVNNTTSLTFRAEGIGGFIEEELNNGSDSVTYLIRLNGAEAAEKFTGYLPTSELIGLRLMAYDQNPVTVRVYTNLAGVPLLTIPTCIPEGSTWTRCDFSTPIPLHDFPAFYISVTSALNSLGYTATGQGKNRAYLRQGGNFIDLDNFKVDNKVLSGDWMLHALVRQNITVPAQLSLEPDSLWFWNAADTQTVLVMNRGTEPLHWQVTTTLPSWLSLLPPQGTINANPQELQVCVRRAGLNPGVHNQTLTFNTDDGLDSLFISVLERNKSRPQAALYPINMELPASRRRLSMRVFNIGPATADFHFISHTKGLFFIPDAGQVTATDTLTCEVFYDPALDEDQILPFSFFNGIDTIDYSFYLTGSKVAKATAPAILPPFPNPFVQSNGHLKFYIPLDLEADREVRLQIFNLRGAQLREWRISNPKAGLNILEWEGADQFGRPAASGVYLLLLEQHKKFYRRKIVLLR